MRHLIVVVLTFAVACNVWAQKQSSDELLDAYESVNYASTKVNKKFTPPLEAIKSLKSGSVSESAFQVQFVSFPEEAKEAFMYALSIYESQISSSVPINIKASWESLNMTILSKCGPSGFYKNFDGAKVADVLYPVALVEKLTSREWNESNSDIDCTFNNSASWYFGTDGNTPSNKYDFVSNVLHEITHGLGFSGFLKVENEQGLLNNNFNLPSVFDYYVYNGAEQQLSNGSIFESPSSELSNELTSNNLFLYYNNEENCQYNNVAAIYAPDSWRTGSSIYHLHNDGHDDHGYDNLMAASIPKGRAIHQIGETTIQILAGFGWKNLSFQMADLKDIEDGCEELPISIQLNSDLSLDTSSVEIVFSTDYFSTSNSITLKHNCTTNQFEGKLPLDNFLGKVKYYLKAKTTDNRFFTQPAQAPEKNLTFKIGPDYYPPTLKHNPTKLISNSNTIINFSATAEDNVGVHSVKIEYKINGIEQESLKLSCEIFDNYNGDLAIPIQLSNDDIIEYRVIAEDNSVRRNKKQLPEVGYYKVKVYEPQMPVTSFFSDFNSISNDFTTTDFEITTPTGFSNGNLHTNHPYQESVIENEKYSLIAQLNHPVILEENGQMTFDEVVLVEPGEPGANFTEKVFWDFVIVEGSKDNGNTWHPFIDGYDSSVNETWETQFSNSLKSNVSSASGNENLFWKNYITLTENEFFSAGDTVLFRFRLASDKFVTGWGWAIDNLKIQSLNTSNDEIVSEGNVAIYPNPFTSSLFVDCSKLTNPSEVVVQITDLVGKTVFRETKYDAQYNPKLQVNLPGIKSGIYLASITDADLNTITQKIIKH
ncbi:MAG: T9SS type A sorting domain-containing protein [Draconibacterium sp.]|nr:T9SS type A sorting domain-containing protein [Draconibacterium sp.]